MDRDLRFTYLILLICFQIGGQILADETMILVNIGDEYKSLNDGMQINQKNNEDVKIDPSLIISSIQKRLGKIPDLHRRSRFETGDLEEKNAKRFEKLPATEISQTTDRTKTLMLVLPFNSDTTGDSIQELYNRPPVTKVIDNVGVSKQTKPLKQVNIFKAKVVEKSLRGENMAPTTYKPLFYPKGLKKSITITTYRPIISPVDNKLSELNSRNSFVNKIEKYSSHYNAEKSSIIGPKFKPLKIENNKNLGNTNLNLDVESRFDQDIGSKETEQNSGIISKPMLSSTIKQHQIRIEERKPLVSISLKPKRYDGFNYISPNIKANDFTNFKPIVIKDNGNVEPGIQKYLHRYRLLEETPITSVLQTNKYPPNEKKLNSTFPSIIKITKRIDSDLDDTEPDNSEAQPEIANSLSNLDNYKQLKKLLQNIQELQNLNISLHENLLKESDQEKLSTSIVDEPGPNPINPEDNPDIDLKLKNEIKRQNNNKTESTKISLDSEIDSDKEASTESSSEDESTTEASKDVSAEKLANLEDSFGSLDNLDPITEEPLPPPRKNGFYFLADVNKFLEVGQDEDKVVVRFSQKIGDPSRFIPVKIPK